MAARTLAILSAVVGVGVIALGIFIVAVGILRYLLTESSFYLLFGVAIILLGSLALIVAYGIHGRRAWVRLLGTWSGLVYVVFGVLFVTGNSVLVGLASTLFGGAIAFYLNTKMGKEYLGRAPR